MVVIKKYVNTRLVVACIAILETSSEVPKGFKLRNLDPKDAGILCGRIIYHFAAYNDYAEGLLLFCR